KRSAKVLCVAPRLFLSVIRIKVLALGFEDAQNAAQSVLKQIVDPAGRGVQLQLNLLRVQQVPTTRSEGFVDLDPGENFASTSHRLASSIFATRTLRNRFRQRLIAILPLESAFIPRMNSRGLLYDDSSDLSPL